MHYEIKNLIYTHSRFQSGYVADSLMHKISCVHKIFYIVVPLILPKFFIHHCFLHNCDVKSDISQTCISTLENYCQGSMNLIHGY